MRYSQIYLRETDHTNKTSVALLTPKDVRKLTRQGIAIFVEMSETRVYSDEEYLKNGGIITTEPWYSPLHRACLIIGWYPPTELDKLHQHVHLCISNHFSDECLDMFKQSNSTLYFCDNMHIIPYHHTFTHNIIAGYAAAGLGLSQLYVRHNDNQSMGEIGQWTTQESLYMLLDQYFQSWDPITIGIVGIQTDYGKGVKSMLDDLTFHYTLLDQSKMDCLDKLDIIFFCDCEYSVYTKEQLHIIYHKDRKHSVWVDVTSEIVHHSHPLHHLCPRYTTIYNPVAEISDTLDIIALDNYNLLFPNPSSIEISDTLLNIITCDTSFSTETNIVCSKHLESSLVTTYIMSLPAGLSFPSDSSDIENGMKRNLERYEEWHQNMCSKVFSTKAEFFDYFAMTESWDLEQECYDFMQYVHPDEAVRNASVAASKQLSEFSNKWAMNTDFYKAILLFYDTFRHDLEGEEILYMERTMQSYKHRGIHLEKETRNKLEALNTQLSELSIQYNANLGEVKDCLYLSSDDLNGVDVDFLGTLDKKDDKYKITTQYDHINKIMPYCEVEATRKALSQLFGMRGKEPYKNHELLQKALDLRKEKVGLLDHANYADYILSNRRMAKNSTQVLEFLNDLVEKMQKSSVQDVKQLAAHFEKEEMESWNLSYYTNLYKKSVLQLDQQEVQKYFPLEKLLPNLLGTFETIFQLRITECELEASQTWHGSVKCYAVHNAVEGETEDLIGHFYVDLYPREGKYGHAAAFTLKQAYVNEEGRSTPVSAMVCNFTRATKEKPSLLTFGEVETFFHELGHIFHQLMSKNRFSMFSGTAVEQDFVECPSQALENWCYEPEFLTRISSHYETGDVMPTDMMKKLKDNKQFCNGLHYIRQLQFALYDMELHSSSEHRDVITTYNELQSKYSPLVHCESCMAANFGHLMGGYESGYYGYLWSEVYAAEVFQLFKNSGDIFNREIGLHYRRCILERGGTQDGFTMMQNLLGRMPNSDAFLEQFA